MQDRRADTSSGQNARVPVISPPTQPSSSSVEGNVTPTGPGGSSSDLRKNRLPPRSRSGCWTCRTRKVKCDEQRPSCGQCVRLEHICDYNPRLSFRDDTSRVVERMQDVTRAGSAVWDPTTPIPDQRQNRSLQDLLPPFWSLTTDEEREKKAESVDPGTYHVVTNPSSFKSLPEYQDEGDANRRDTRSYAGFSASEYGDSASDPRRAPLAGPADPNVVILRKFVDPVRRSISQPSTSPATTTPASPTSSHAHVAGTSQPTSEDLQRGRRSSSTRTIETVRQDGRDTQLLQHYQKAFSTLILGKDRSTTGEDMFEIQAKTYPPLFHAMMALTALNLAQYTGGNGADALEHYQQVIPALKSTVQSSQDSYSDGALLTHFVLLLYEVAASPNHESSMWLQHCAQLQRIITLRHQANGFEPYEFLVWKICCIDVYALLSANGAGAFIEVMLSQKMFPPPERCYLMDFSEEEHVFRPEEQAALPGLLKLNQDVVLLALKVGQLARDLRAEFVHRQRQNPNQRIPQDVFAVNRRNRVHALLRHIYDCRAAWRDQSPDYWTWLSGPKRVPARVFAWVTHPYVLFRACMIYAHTSMYHGQLQEPALEFETEVSTSSKEIIQAVHMILSHDHYELRFVVFGLFMAGFATKDSGDKAVALSLMKRIEEKIHGANIATAIRLLETMYDKQRTATIQMGDASSVNWVEEMESSAKKFMMV